MTGRRRDTAVDLAMWRRIHFFVQQQQLKMKGEPRAKGDGPIERAARKFHRSRRQIERILAKYTPDTAIATTMREAFFTKPEKAFLETFNTSVKPVLEAHATIKRNLTESEMKLLADAGASIAFALGIAQDRECLRRLAQRKRKVTDKK